MARKNDGACGNPKLIRTDVDCRAARPKFNEGAWSSPFRERLSFPQAVGLVPAVQVGLVQAEVRTRSSAREVARSDIHTSMTALLRLCHSACNGPAESGPGW